MTCWSGFGVAGGSLLLGLWVWANEKKGVKDGLLGLGQGLKKIKRLTGLVSLSPAPTPVASENDIP